MENVSDLNKIKAISKGLLDISILETEYSPIIVSHPFTKCGIVLLPNEDYAQVDITKDKSALNKWKKAMAEQIDSCTSVYQIYHIVNEAYSMLFFHDIASSLSKEDSAWVSNDYANLDANVSKSEMLKHFKLADRKLMMTDSEYESYESLDKVVTVYRGLTPYNKKNIKALSWTTSFGKAKWFSERFGKGGKIYAASISKDDIYAYFDRKGEDEVVVDYNKLMDIRQVDKPIPRIRSKEDNVM